MSPLLPALYDGAYPANTELIGFLEAPIPLVLEAADRWNRIWARRDPRPLRDILATHLATRDVLVGTDAAWTAMFGLSSDNAEVIAGYGGFRAAVVRLHPDPDRPDRANFVSLMVRRPRPGHVGEYPGEYERLVMAYDNDGRWDFVQRGEPYPWEQLERYEARRVRDRFTPEMLVEYCARLGLRPFDESFYQGECVLFGLAGLRTLIRRALGRSRGLL